MRFRTTFPSSHRPEPYLYPSSYLPYMQACRYLHCSYIEGTPASERAGRLMLKGLSIIATVVSGSCDFFMAEQPACLRSLLLDRFHAICRTSKISKLQRSMVVKSHRKLVRDEVRQYTACARSLIKTTRCRRHELHVSQTALSVRKRPRLSGTRRRRLSLKSTAFGSGVILFRSMMRNCVVC